MGLCPSFFSCCFRLCSFVFDFRSLSFLCLLFRFFAFSLVSCVLFLAPSKLMDLLLCVRFWGVCLFHDLFAENLGILLLKMPANMGLQYLWSSSFCPFVLFTLKTQRHFN